MSATPRLVSARNDPPVEIPAQTRCAIYTRKSTEEGLAQAFNSLDAQREAAEAFILSQRQQGWTALAEHYDDGGCTGANLERPALQRLLAGIENGRIDCVIVYKVDRLSRSLLDFARLMGVFDRHGVSFVSVTQQFNTTASLGRLTLNILLSFAQFERELIAERTRDKMRAARRKGKWTGGMPVLGYDLDRANTRLIVNAEEAGQVRAIFDLYLEHQSIAAVLALIAEHGWLTKRRRSREGAEHGGTAFTRTSLVRLLRNVVYTGRIRQEQTLHAGEHEPIVDVALWEKVNACLTSDRQVRPPLPCRSKALLGGLLHCDNCGRVMRATSTAHNGRRYRYYGCPKRCATKPLAADRMERSVVEQILGWGSEQKRAEEMARCLCAQQPRIESRVSERELASALERLPEAWGAMTAAQQIEAVRRLIERIGYDHSSGRVTLKLRATAAGTLHRLAGGDLDAAKHNGTAADATNQTRTAVSAGD